MVCIDEEGRVALVVVEHVVRQEELRLKGQGVSVLQDAVIKNLEFFL